MRSVLPATAGVLFAAGLWALARGEKEEARVAWRREIRETMPRGPSLRVAAIAARDALARPFQLPRALAREAEQASGEEDDAENNVAKENGAKELPKAKEAAQDVAASGSNAVTRSKKAHKYIPKTVWGPPAWEKLHKRMSSLPATISAETAKAESAWLFSFFIGLPCPSCAMHALGFMKKHPVPFDQGGEAVSLWTCQLHNEVNRIKGKPQMAEDEYRKRYLEAS